MDNRPIGVMDSGIGGLTVVKELQSQLPNESIEFVGDQARLPYGVRPSEEVREFSMQIAQFLLQKNIKLLVIACNTATAAALSYLQDKLQIPVIGVIAPGSAAALQLPQHNVIGVIATQKTIEDRAYSKEINQLDAAITVIGLASQEFVALVEEDLAGTPQAQKVVTKKLSFYHDHPVDALILGCTHFPLLTKEIGQAMGAGVPLIDPGVATVEDVIRLLKKQNLAANQAITGSNFYTTGEPDKFNEVARKWLNNNKLNAKKIKLGDK
ncbi:glutamate racemase [Paucilactobacillus hokkaidonensis JCM 18461]|uniref:Glutamate racemase n=2 Tax=Paucilactobacillus hokkaidonensis TaxID=1193095 RepID=A0A0A1GVL4_9LACO|nr:glutamate racemase [Paucilactobacillus hokkaidonensis]KRO10511.1 glutamate racemase [Paucilactobacillus hokkaidonensis]BAP86030.1 glutamate racemase [Paucilactobacillus hokkaidonensis JCM 18461]